ncbi:MAG: hypothetical protein QHH74_14540, partial [Spirochaetota bacterium]|nr:hypothetical protein [Spirochaetota bacterium]
MKHKRSFDKRKTAYKKYKEKTWQLYNTLIEQCRHYYTTFIELVVNPQADTKKRYRMVLLAASVICIIDYAAISVLTDKNIFDIYPSLPELDTRETIDIFVADLDAKSILKETREVS